LNKYYSINQFSKILGVSAQTLRNWNKNGKLYPHHLSKNGYRYYSKEQIDMALNIKTSKKRINIDCDKVSENKSKNKLEQVTHKKEKKESLQKHDIVETLVQITIKISDKLQEKQSNMAKKMVNELTQEHLKRRKVRNY